MSTYTNLILASSPRAYYPLSEISGLPQDLSGNALHMSVATGSAGYGQPGIPGDPPDTAISFNGAQEFHAANASFSLGDVFTLEAWIKRNTATANDYAIVSKGVGAYLMRLSSDNKIHLLKDGTADISGSTATITDTTTWHYVACTKNGASTVTIDIDGVEGHSAPTADVCVDNAGADFAIGVDAGTLTYANMVMAHLAVYPTVLSAATRLSHFNAGITVPGAILPQWPRIRFNG